MLVVVAAMLSPLGIVPLAMVVVDAGSKISAGETVAKVGLVDLFIATMRTHERLELDCPRRLEYSLLRPWAWVAATCRGVRAFAISGVWGSPLNN